MEENTEITETSETINSCRADCKICNHLLIKEIEILKKEKKTYDEIVEIINAKTDDKISKASLWRHFTNYKKIVQAELMRQKFELVQKEANTIKSCQAWTDQFLEESFKAIAENWENVKYKITFDDILTLSKLRVLLAEGDSGPADSILEIFKRAEKQFDIKLSQRSLFSPEARTVQQAEIVQTAKQ